MGGFRGREGKGKGDKRDKEEITNAFYTFNCSIFASLLRELRFYSLAIK
jgi:hypothetical protein